MLHMIRRNSAILLLAGASIVLAGPASATIGDASLFVAGASSTPTHWDIPLDATTTVELRGVSMMDVGGPLPSMITVWVKSSEYGNTMLTAMRIGTTSDYTFDYTPPMDACGTTIVAYVNIGWEANNDLADDGMLNGSGTAASGLRFVDTDGMPVECPVSVEGRSWGMVKAFYR